MSQATTVFATYRVQKDKEADFHVLLEKHWPTLKELDLVTDEPPAVYRHVDDEGRPTLVEIFTWKDADAPGKAHVHPAVSSIWEPMGALVEERNGAPRFEFPHYERIELRTEV